MGDIAEHATSHPNMGTQGATAKRNLARGEKLYGEGGLMVYGKLMPAAISMEIDGLPIGLAHGIVVKRAVIQGQLLSCNHFEYSETSQAVAVRKEMEAVFKAEFARTKKGNGHTIGH
jgi:predicted homoserine dehydrogenase-like protein